LSHSQLALTTLVDLREGSARASVPTGFADLDTVTGGMAPELFESSRAAPDWGKACSSPT